ncbi:MAG: endonuclease/exonuclease/phosphatase family protein [Kiritimatiellaeota bacterium]|nr:endonuclease/exonuclease/phosphatase family protein [Kiritimatiellota bacterium]
MKLQRFIVVWLAIAACAWGAKVETLRVATWNVDNFFDAVQDETNPNDDYYPTSWRRWTQARYEKKTENLAKVIAAMKPDIVCLQELENLDVLTNLTQKLRDLPEGAMEFGHIAHRQSQDQRRISNGVISRYPIKDVALAQHVSGMRGMLRANIDVDGAEVTVFVTHWKSWVGDAKVNIAIRMQEAKGVRQDVNAFLDANPHGTLIVCGDFNDNCDGLSITNGLFATMDRETVLTNPVKRYLYNTLGELPKESLGTYYYARYKVWNTFDALMVTSAMLAPPEEKGSAWRFVNGSTTLFKYPDMVGADGRPRSFERIRLKDGTDKYDEGYSDHYPVYIDLRRQ